MCLLSPDLENVLYNISSVLSKMRIAWILVGSTASCLNGVNVKPKDIDIIVKTEDVYVVDRIFASAYSVLRRVKYSSNGVYSSHYGIFETQGVKIEVMADLKICGELGCLDVDFEELYSLSRRIELRDTSLRVAPLEWQLVANTLIAGKEERIEKILGVIVNRGINTKTLELVLNKAPLGVRKYIIKLLKEKGITCK